MRYQWTSLRLIRPQQPERTAAAARDLRMPRKAGGGGEGREGLFCSSGSGHGLPAHVA
ncbi:hypothetical protein SSAG_05229 [Streptomyces sp. Mg1]|nr:hypothetical protein SSAG_05229 [Streptomyces sp. Mg1]